MNIGFDAKRYFHNKSGLGNYSRDLIDALISKHPEHHYCLFDSHAKSSVFPNHVEIVNPQSFSPAWKSFSIQREIKKHQIDVFHGLSNALPYGKWPSFTKKLVTIHDVIFKTHPSFYPFLDRQIYHHQTKHALKIADKVIATTAFTAEQIALFYNVNPNKLEVIYQTCGSGHWRVYSRDEINAYKLREHLPETFILYVSSFQKRKNHIQILKALKACHDENVILVLAGRIGETYQKCLDFIQENELANQVHLKTDIKTEDLPLLYRSANAFCYPSMIEGFGIPLIEAACAGLPIAINNIPVFKELAPSNSVFFDSENIEEFAKSIIELTQIGKQDYSTYLEKFKGENATQQMLDKYSLFTED